MDDESTERLAEVSDDVRDRMVADIYARWVNLVLLARMGNGTWRQTDRLVRFELVFPLDNDADIRVRINDEDGLWSQPRAARSFKEGHVLEPDDIVVELLELPDVRPERYILAQFDGEHWQLEITLNVAHPRRLEHLAAALEFETQPQERLRVQPFTPSTRTRSMPLNTWLRPSCSAMGQLPARLQTPRLTDELEAPTNCGHDWTTRIRDSRRC